MNLLDYVKLYIDLGWSIIPVDSHNKGGAPFSWKEYQERRASLEEALSWWKRWPDYGIAIVTGGISNLVVADLDCHGEQNGIAVAEARFGLEATGPYVVTGGDGQHLYFLHPGFCVRNRTGAGALAPGVEIKGDGGFVYAPPSVHPSGKEYIWNDAPWDGVAIPPCPEQMIKLLRETPAQASAGSGDALDNLLAGVAEPGRNAATARLAGRYFALGMNHEEVLILLTGWNQRNTTPLEPKELARVVDSIHKRERAKHDASNSLDYANDDDRKAILDAMNDVFWPGHQCRIIEILRGKGENPVYVFETSQGTILIQALKIGAQNAWRNAMIEATGQVPRRIGQKAKVDWDTWLQRMLDVARDVEPGEEATLSGQVAMWLESYLEKRPAADPGGDEDLDRAEDPQLADGKRYIHLGDFLAYVHGMYDPRIGHRALAQRLALWGCWRKIFNIKQGDKRVCRSKWCIEPILKKTEEQTDGGESVQNLHTE